MVALLSPATGGEKPVAAMRQADDPANRRQASNGRELRSSGSRPGTGCQYVRKRTGGGEDAAGEIERAPPPAVTMARMQPACRHGGDRRRIRYRSGPASVMMDSHQRNLPLMRPGPPASGRRGSGENHREYLPDHHRKTGFTSTVTRRQSTSARKAWHVSVSFVQDGDIWRGRPPMTCRYPAFRAVRDSAS